VETATEILSTAEDSELREEIAARLATQLAGAAPKSRAAPITSRGHGSGRSATRRSSAAPAEADDQNAE
jgi:hypothetical protein